MLGETPSPHTYLQISPENLLDFVHTAFPQKNPLVDEETFFICDLSSYSTTAFNSLLFQIDGSIFKSTESTTKIMKRFFKTHISYETIQYLGKIIGIRQKCPYVLGSMQFSPDKGPTKQHANWFGMHHVTHAEASDKVTQLNIVNHHELSVEISHKTIITILEHTLLLYQTQQKLSKEWLQLFAAPNQSNRPMSVIERMYQEEQLKASIPSPISWHTQLIYFLAQNVLIQLFKEGNPYIDEVKETFLEIEKEIS
jgi:competence transcription factor ComK